MGWDMCISHCQNEVLTASANPKKNRVANNPAPLVTAAMLIDTAPQQSMTMAIHFLGPIFLSYSLQRVVRKRKSS